MSESCFLPVLHTTQTFPELSTADFGSMSYGSASVILMGSDQAEPLP